MQVDLLADEISYSFVVPPTLFLVTGVVGGFVALRWRMIGFALTFASLLFLYAFATPFVSNRLLATLECCVAHHVFPNEHPGAIVVLGGDIHTTPDHKQYLGLLSLERVYGADREYRTTHLPILVSGGTAGPPYQSLADVMATVLQDSFNVEPRWRETRSQNTYENAEFSAEILKENGISSVVLVTQSWHMPRATWSFARFGIHAVPADFPIDLMPSSVDLDDLLPSVPSLLDSVLAVHEFLGITYYRFAHPKSSKTT